MALVLAFVGCQAKSPRATPTCEGPARPSSGEPGVQMIQAADGLGIAALAVDPNGLFLTAESGGIKIWQLETRTLLRTLPSLGPHRAVAWSSAERFVVDNQQINAQGVIVGEKPPTEYDLTGRRIRDLPEGWRIIPTSTGATLQRASRQGDELVVQRINGTERRVQWPAAGCELGTAADQIAPMVSTNERTVACVEHHLVRDRAETIVHIWHLDGGNHRALVVPGWADQVELDADGLHARVDVHDFPSVWGTVNRLDTRTGALTRITDWDRAWHDARHTTTATSLDGHWAATVNHALLPAVDMQSLTGKKVTWRWNTIWTGITSFNGNQIDHLYFTPDSALLVVVLFSGEMVLLEPEGGHVVARFGAPVDLASPAFAPDPHHLVFIAGDQVIRWDLARAQSTELGSYECKTGTICPLELHDNAVYLWSHPKVETELGPQVDPTLFVVGRGTFEAPPQLDGKRVDPETVPVWGRASWPLPVGRPIVAQVADASVVQVSMVHATALVDIGDPARCAVVDLRSGERHDLAGVSDPCGQRLVGTVDYMRGVHSNGIQTAMQENATPGMHFTWRFEPNHIIGSGWAVAAGETPSAVVAMWDRRGGHKLSIVLPFRRSESIALAGAKLSPDSKTLVVAFGNEQLWQIDVATGKVTEVDFEDGVEVNAGWLPNGDLLVSRSDGVIERRRGVVVVESATGDRIRAYIDTASPDGSWFDVRRIDGTVQIWRTAPLAPAATLVAFSDHEYLAYTPDGYFTGTADVGDRVAWVFDHPFEGFGFAQYAAQFRRPDIVAARLAGTQTAGKATAFRPPRITVSPPRLSGGRASIHVTTTSAGRVDLLRAFVDGEPVGAKAVCATSAAVDLDVAIHPGNNRITVAAYDAAGLGSRWASTTATGPSSKARPRLWVVAVGVSSYPKLAPDQQLEVADDDARAISDAFRREVSRGTFRSADVSLLLDHDAKADTILQKLRRLEAMAPDDLAVIFFAGHGVKVGASGLDDRGEMMFLTSEASLTQPAGIRWRDVATAIGRARGRVVLLLDACHAGHFSRDLVIPSDDLAGAFESRGGALVFSAAKGRQLSYEPSASRGLRRTDIKKAHFTTHGAPHGLFTAALLDTLDDADADLDHDGDLALSEWIAAVTEQVGRVSNGRQTPWVARRELHGDLAIARAGHRRPLAEANAAHPISCSKIAQRMIDLVLVKAKALLPADDVDQHQLLVDNARRAKTSVESGCILADLPDAWRSCAFAAATFEQFRSCAVD